MNRFFKPLLALLLFFVAGYFLSGKFDESTRSVTDSSNTTVDLEKNRELHTDETGVSRTEPHPETGFRNERTPATANSDQQTANSFDQSSPESKQKLLAQIINSKNDNDPRLDSEFNNLSEAQKSALREYYKKLRPEELNARGTTIFVLSKNITNINDAEFLKSVLKEAACLSLNNCAVAESQDDVDLAHGDDVTKNYPQLVALNRIQNWIRSPAALNSSMDVRNKVLEAILSAKNSPVSIVSRKALETESLYRDTFRLRE